MAGGIGLGDTTYTKVFVGGLAWETHKETMKKHFEQFGEILEAVVITDKASGRSKGYGFVTFREAEAARRACVDATPVIDGRRANCNLASLGLVQRSKPSTPNHGGGGRINNMRVMMSTMQTGFGPPPPPTFPHYPPISLFGYSPYSSSDYSPFPTILYGMYGANSSGGQYRVYGNGGGGGLTAAAAPFYPCRGGSNSGVYFSQPQSQPFYHQFSSYNNPHHYSPPTISLQQGLTGVPIQPPLIPYRLKKLRNRLDNYRASHNQHHHLWFL